MEEQLQLIVILLPLHPTSLTHKKCKRNKIIHGMHVDRSEDVYVEYPVCTISVAVLVAAVYQDIFLFVFVVLYDGRSFLFE